MSDPVNHPAHYHSTYVHGVCGKPIECIDVVRHLGFNLGNAIKYIWRAGKKGDAIEDLKKARWYLDDQIKLLEMKKAVKPVVEPPPYWPKIHRVERGF